MWLQDYKECLGILRLSILVHALTAKMCNGFRQSCTVTGHEIHLEEQMCLANKKKSICKRITGFQVAIYHQTTVWSSANINFLIYLVMRCQCNVSLQYLPQDPFKVMVTSADSHVRILDGINVIGKYKGLFPFLISDSNPFDFCFPVIWGPCACSITAMKIDMWFCMIVGHRVYLFCFWLGYLLWSLHCSF